METTINQDIRAALDRLGPGEPIALAAVSGDHAHFLDNWLLFLDRLKIDRVMIVAMDEVMAARMRPGRFPVIRAGFDGTEADFWRQRLRVWRRLADAGVAFIQSDTDAIWLSDPRPMLAGLDGDLVFSQGTRLPEDTLEAWGFVLCCGFFLARPTPATIALFAEIEAREDREQDFDDQIILNRILVADGTRWDRPAKGMILLELQGAQFMTFRVPLTGVCASRGLKVNLLPHHLFPRLQPNTPEAIVRHVLRGPDPSARIDLMRAVGCWAIDDGPANPQ